jgi:hypothetical protein
VICAVLEYYVEYNGNYSPTFRDNLSVPSSRLKNPEKYFLGGFSTIENGTDRLSRNFAKELLLYVGQYPRGAQISAEA